jgi:hypothetical protein
MSVTYNWIVERMDCFPQMQDQANVVFTVFWRLDATDGTHTCSAFGSQAIPYADLSGFTAYATLTQDQVVGWVQAAMYPGRVNELEANLAIGIQNLVDPPVVTPALPWA